MAQPAVGAACVGMLRLLGALGLEPDLVGGHSYGELVALHAAGVLGARELAELSSARGRFMIEAGRGASGAMAAILAGPDEVERLVREVPGVQAANWNGPRQTVIAGPAGAVERAVESRHRAGIGARMLPVSSAFHTPMVAGAREPLSRLARDRLRRSPDRPVYSNIDAAPYPDGLPAIAARLGEHLASPVRFADMIEAMYRDGARVFVEVGPGAILTSMVGSILEDRPHLAISGDGPTTPGLPALLRMLARLVVAGLPLRLERLTAGRADRRLDLDHLAPGGLAEPPTASTWLVNGSRARPFAAPEPVRLGTRPVLPVPAPESHETKARGPSRTIGHNHSNGNGNGKLNPPMTIKPPLAPTVPAAPAAPAAPTFTHPQADPVLESFQKTMQIFLEVQKATMLAYLNGRGASGASAPPAHADGPRGHHAPHRNGDATTTLEYRLQAESDLPDRLKPGLQPRDAHDLSNGNGHHPTPSWRPESRITTPQRSTAPLRIDEPTPVGSSSSTPPAPERRDVPAPDRPTITARLLEIVRDRTGYPIETLGLDLDIEADLGIDSIKRVEILGKLRDEFPALKGPSDSAELMDALARARTLGAIVDRMVAMAAAVDVEPRAGPILLADPQLRTPHSALRISMFGILESPSEPIRRSPMAEAGRVERRVLEAVPAPLPRDRRRPDGGRPRGDHRRRPGRGRGAGGPAGGGGHRGGSPGRSRAAGRMDVAVGHRRGGGRGPVAGRDRRPRARDAARPAGAGWIRRRGLVRSDRRRRQGPVPAGQVDGRRPGIGRGGGRFLPDRGDGDGRPIRRGRRRGRCLVLPRPWRRRRAGQDARPGMADGPVPRGGPAIERAGRHAGRPGWPTRSSPSTAGRRSATTAVDGSGCGPSSGPARADGRRRSSWRPASRW